MARAILNWRILGNDLVGTHHLPAPDPAPVGVLLLNGGPAPRAGNSDLSVHIGEDLASRGIPVFRFDLPGLGDSTGPIPADIDGFWHEVLAGRNDETTLLLARELRRAFNLRSIIIGGLCAAAIPALRVADIEDSGVSGVILLEPQFRLTDPTARRVPTAADRSVGARRRARLRRALSGREWLYALTGEGRLASAAKPLRPLLLRALQKSVGNTLPRDTNVALVCRLKSCLDRGLHSLMVIAENQVSDHMLMRIVEGLPPGRPGQCTLARIPQTNHILTTGPARAMVLAAIRKWMHERYTAAQPALRISGTPPPQSPPRQRRTG